MKGRVCNFGLYDESIPDIQFDASGKSNYAVLFENLNKAYPYGKEGTEFWESTIKKIKHNGKGKRYDCVIGISGGTDSCYLLHLAKQWGLRPLAVNLDNGWNSNISVQNIKKLTQALDVDLITYVVDYEEIKDLIKSYMKASLAWIDLPTDLAIKAVLYKIALKENIKYILRGNDFRSEGSQPKDWTYGDGKQLSAIHKQFGSVQLKTFPNYTISNLLFYAFVKQIKSVYPFYYLEYDKQSAKKFLIENYAWEDYGGHHHENIFTKFAMSYWLYVKFGIDKRIITYSAKVLNKKRTREEVLIELSKTPYNVDEIDDLIAYICKKLDLTKSEFDDLMTRPNKTFRDYPSYDHLLQKFDRLSRWFIPKLFLHRPQSMYRKDIIGQ
jgi:N-acetyl sugar amidotransferase